MKKIDLTNFEGTADQLGEQVFKQLIAPMLDEMKSQDAYSAVKLASGFNISVRFQNGKHSSRTAKRAS